MGVRPMAAMRAHLLTLLCLLLAVVARAQRRPPPQEDEDYGRGNRLSGRARSGGGQPDLSLDVAEFPYPRGETPVFNFDQGDEGFIGTIPPLIHALDAVKDTVHKQRKITQHLVKLLTSVKLA